MSDSLAKKGLADKDHTRYRVPVMDDVIALSWEHYYFITALLS